MKKYQKQHKNQINAPFYQNKSAYLDYALENALIFVTLLIAISAALYILNGQITRLV